MKIQVSYINYRTTIKKRSYPNFFVSEPNQDNLQFVRKFYYNFVYHPDMVLPCRIFHSSCYHFSMERSCCSSVIAPTWTWNDLFYYFKIYCPHHNWNIEWAIIYLYRYLIFLPYIFHYFLQTIWKIMKKGH